MATFVLIHGAWHGGWAWEAITPLMEARGHVVVAPNLPGMGGDSTPWADDVLGQRIEFVAALVELQPDPVILVGHSNGGLLVSAVAERLPRRVALAIYLAAFLLADGESIADVDERTDVMHAAISTDEAGGCLHFDAELAVAALYGRCTCEAAVRAAARLTAEPMQPFGVRLGLGADRFGRVPRAYVETTDDRAIPLAKQRQMQTRLPCGKVITLDSDHSPFISKPEQLAEILDDLCKPAWREPT